ncbi:hypothetical protein COS31_00865 [Candidatus Roizmanbacteria bacterium CG02_land_8_20_14_3_00_36_15]|uniref:Uncharacterized protein n=2 Tax=Candidatus Roizmaniibacteriota TaxID=1752723 RepID=A0A2M8KJU5_9BACT|nr:MAG: hypothetical protein COS51_01430 [Candidatus Roizmanbacteria bacterium CG03_land_8_20_14_0_80_36_21]PIV38163.1 MAG: hypothetical protein COS31_00865 [Candidatus Roizmanbacteria bacterium CG02_land_8_20_14_3_00_36_15]PIY69602.1 MAG: hypothetical protein COY89_05545 [Candidatus Roizmanbacteria bacterium CG_4_10_14_0_8_um_filter_36_36]PJA53676.1 MAG: hypothetical protein CO166_00830 [Candidatus Roizmanbacteria bacterium CG_4_9_14_3_um_filter_36_11]PJC81836.1 MAG: hypothetical protein CO007
MVRFTTDETWENHQEKLFIPHVLSRLNAMDFVDNNNIHYSSSCDAGHVEVAKSGSCIGSSTSMPILFTFAETIPTDRKKNYPITDASVVILSEELCKRAYKITHDFLPKGQKSFMLVTSIGK